MGPRLLNSRLETTGAEHHINGCIVAVAVSWDLDQGTIHVLRSARSDYSCMKAKNRVFRRIERSHHDGDNFFNK